MTYVYERKRYAEAIGRRKRALGGYFIAATAFLFVFACGLILYAAERKTAGRIAAFIGLFAALSYTIYFFDVRYGALKAEERLQYKLSFGKPEERIVRVLSIGERAVRYDGTDGYAVLCEDEREGEKYLLYFDERKERLFEAGALVRFVYVDKIIVSYEAVA